MFVKSQKQATYVIHFTRVKSKDLPKDTGILWGNIYKCRRCCGNCKLAALHHPPLIGFEFWSPHSHLNVNNFVSCLKAERNNSFNWRKTTRVTIPVRLPQETWRCELGGQCWDSGGIQFPYGWRWVVVHHSVFPLLAKWPELSQAVKTQGTYKSYLLQWVNKSWYITPSCCILSGKIKSLY